MLTLAGNATYMRRAERVDLEALKHAQPVQEVVARYGIELRRRGRTAVGRCPFHPDGGRPNLYVWADTRSWWCFRCNVGGDVIRFVELAESLSFREAVERLSGASLGRLAARITPLAATSVAVPAGFENRDSDELTALQAATTVYHHRLLTDPQALAYVTQRGIDRAAVQNYRIGYAAGDELMAFLRWRRLPLGPALRVGLLNHAGREFLAGRIVVPELREGHPVWLVGRILEQVSQADGNAVQPPPKYLALRGTKPLLGWEQARGSTTVIAVEGVFDLLTLRNWGFPAVALVGTHTSPDVLDQLRTFRRVYLVLDQDMAGREATVKLVEALGPNTVPVELPEGVKDVAELAPRQDGQDLFAAALLESVGAAKPVAWSEPIDQRTPIDAVGAYSAAA
jgi:DNA primase